MKHGYAFEPVKPLLFASVRATSNGDNTVVSADTTRKIKVCSYVIVADGIVSAKWKDSTGSDLTGAMALITSSGVSAIGGTTDSWLFETSINANLILNLSGAVGISGHISYFLEA